MSNRPRAPEADSHRRCEDLPRAAGVQALPASFHRSAYKGPSRKHISRILHDRLDRSEESRLSPVQFRTLNLTCCGGGHKDAGGRM